MLAEITVGDPIIVAAVPVTITGLVSLVAYLFRQIRASDQALAKVAEVMAAMEARMASVEQRVHRLEGFQDGVQFGRVTSH